MRERDEVIRREIEACGPRRRGRQFPTDVRNRAISHARAEMACGRSRLELAKSIGVADQTLRHWLAPDTFVPVEIESRGSTMGLVATSPGGWRVEGLGIEQLAELLRRVS
jgi:hypothetical protein